MSRVPHGIDRVLVSTPVTSAYSNRGDTQVRISTFCTGGTCVGVEWCDDDVQIVDTKRVDGERLRFTAAEWQAFLSGVKAGEFDRP